MANWTDRMDYKLTRWTSEENEMFLDDDAKFRQRNMESLRYLRHQIQQKAELEEQELRVQEQKDFLDSEVGKAKGGYESIIVPLTENATNSEDVLILSLKNQEIMEQSTTVLKGGMAV